MFMSNYKKFVNRQIELPLLKSLDYFSRARRAEEKCINTKYLDIF